MRYPERIVPGDTSPGILALHLKRYEFASLWTDEVEVLDAGCGVGFGSAFLARSARRVVGVDRSEEAIAHARANYAAANVEFVQADLLDLPLPDASFDLVCAFETIEHVDDLAAFLQTVVRVLRPGGTALVSTPRVERSTHNPSNPYHRVEFSAQDFEKLLEGSFGAVELYGQRRLQTRRHRIMQRLDVLGLRKRVPWLRAASHLLGTPPTARVGLDDIVIERGAIEDASELVAVCSRPRRA